MNTNTRTGHASRVEQHRRTNGQFGTQPAREADFNFDPDFLDRVGMGGRVIPNPDDVTECGHCGLDVVNEPSGRTFHVNRFGHPSPCPATP